MPILPELIVANARESDLVKQKTDLISALDIERKKLDFSRFDADKVIMATVEEALRTVDATGSIVHETIARYFNVIRDEQKRQMKPAATEAVKLVIDKLEKQLTAVNKELMLLTTNRGIEQKKIEQQLRRFPNYKKNSYTQGVRNLPRLNDSGTPYQYIRFVMTGLKMTPSQNPYKWLNNGERPVIPLGDIEVICDIAKARMHLTQGPHAILFDTPSYAIHPHVMNDRKPCLGSFQAGVQTALTEQKIDELFLLMQAFFEQANQDDSAGINWIHHLVHKLPQGFCLTGRPCKGVVGEFPELISIATGNAQRVTYVDNVVTVVEILPPTFADYTKEWNIYALAA